MRIRIIMGVYTFYLKASLGDGETHHKKGYITLVR
jgi:hypothetical protein